MTPDEFLALTPKLTRLPEMWCGGEEVCQCGHRYDIHSVDGGSCDHGAFDFYGEEDDCPCMGFRQTR